MGSSSIDQTGGGCKVAGCLAPRWGLALLVALAGLRAIFVGSKESSRESRLLEPAAAVLTRDRGRAHSVSEPRVSRGSIANAGSGNNARLRIPRIVHQTWKSHQLYPAQAKWRENCIKANPGWEFKIWNDTENRKLVRDSVVVHYTNLTTIPNHIHTPSAPILRLSPDECLCVIEDHYPWALDTYDSYPNTINRIDAIRIFYLAHFGGVYMDLDYTCLRPFDALLEGSRAAFAEDVKDQNLTNLYFRSHKGLPGVGNSFMAAEKGHPVLLNGTRRLVEIRHKVHDETGNLAGVWFIRELIQQFRPIWSELGLRILPMEAVSPMDWAKGANHREAARLCTEPRDMSACRVRFPKSTTISFWTGTWQVGGPRNARKNKLTYDMSKQEMLGLRKPGDSKPRALSDLEKEAGYSGPSGAIKICTNKHC